MAHPDKLKKDGRAFGIFNKKVNVIYVDNNYMIQGFDEPSKITDTSYLTLGELLPKNNHDLYTFVFRWDEKANALDIDVKNCKDIELIKKFKSDGDKEYHGHHTERVVNNKRSYNVDIIWESKRIFEGTICFNLNREAELNDGFNLGAKLQ
jgi:hypothetical protein